jgi:hypothetical protein
MTIDHSNKANVRCQLWVLLLSGLVMIACGSDRPDFEQDESAEGETKSELDGAAHMSSSDVGQLDAGGTQEGNVSPSGMDADPAGSDPAGSDASSTETDLPDGGPCSTAEECRSGFCVDGVCCETSCAQVCSQCNAPGSEGTCTDAQNDEACGELTCPTDTECRQFILAGDANCVGIGECLLEATCNEATVTEGSVCQDGAGMCIGDGQCAVPDRLLLGEVCTVDDECGSGFCGAAVDGATRCCEGACDGVCEACSVAGRCDEVAADDSRCEAITCPSDTACSAYPPAPTADRCAAAGTCFTEATYCLPAHEDEGVSCGSGQACDGAGSCVSVCSSSQLWCSNTCVDPDTNNSHCGVCGQSCAAGLLCSGGECVPDCVTGQITCGDSCVNPQTDADHCGASGDCMSANAGEPCSAPFACVSGECEVVCSSGQLNCDDTCIDPDTDEMFCGASSACTGPNRGQPCSTGYTCEDGTCRLQCPSGQVGCEGRCISPNDDEDFCGASDYCEGASDGEDCQPGDQCISGTCRSPNGSDCTVGSDCIGGTCTEFFRDEDQDGYGAESSGTWSICGSNPPAFQWVVNDLDCCDLDSLQANQANPDYSSGPRDYGVTGCAQPFDWDCDGVQTPETGSMPCSSYTTQGSCPLGFYPSPPLCGQEGIYNACAWVSNACTHVGGGPVVQECY